MSKKVIRINESQLKDIIKKIIKEQTAPQQAQGPKVPYKHSQTGEQFNAPYIQNDQDLDTFINYGGGGLNQKANLLKSLGMDLTHVAAQENAGIQKGAKPGTTTNFLYINDSITDLLKVVARLNIQPKSISVMSGQLIQKMDEQGIDKNYAKYLAMSLDNHGIQMPTYWATMAKLVDYQIKKLSSGSPAV